jgi:hypothetical protein
MTSTPQQERIEKAATKLLIELAFLMPRGTDLNTHPISSALVEYKAAIEAGATPEAASQTPEGLCTACSATQQCDEHASPVSLRVQIAQLPTIQYGIPYSESDPLISRRKVLALLDATETTPCESQAHQSRVCECGTKGCMVKHDAANI